jgi:hypothetical protein
MKPLTHALVFISYSLRLFLINFLSSLVYLILVTAITTAAFMFAFHTFRKPYLFWLYLAVLAVVNYKIREFLFFRYQTPMNLRFLYFLEGKTDFLHVELPKNPGRTARKLKKEIRNTGLTSISRKVLLAVIVLHMNDSNESMQKVSLPPGIYKYLFFQLIAFLILLVPFGLIAFLFTLGLGVKGTVTYLVYLLGFFFVYFLNAVVVEPISGLMIQEMVGDSASP